MSYCAGFESKQSYGSGFFTMQIKLPDKDSGGVVTAFYLTSVEDGNRDELDFEFLGNREGKPYTLQTNVFAQGIGNREHRIYLWFDPTADFHTYKILWNQHHIVFFADNIPIRYFKNNINFGVGYPSKPMKIEASIWDGSDWATDGGQTKVDWNHAPFRAYFKGFNIDGCQIDKNSGTIEPCNSDKYWWNSKRYWELDPTEQEAYNIVKHHYVTYDYCTDKQNHPVTPPECSQQ
uniref:Xyloglucan endotransglucosylase/hydrolase n=1 Tax=Chenopodium quinoa TaxID=63459 RepID=A0A803KQ02_CHEQI